MGVTTGLGLPYPDPEDLVYLGPNNFQDLAEAAEAEILAPALRLRADNAATVDATDRGDIVSFDTASLTFPFIARGGWTFEDSGSLLIPPTTGIYLVIGQVSKPLDRSSTTCKIETRVSGAAHSTAIIWANPEDITGANSDVIRLVTPGIVLIDAPDVGIQLGIDADSTTNGSCQIAAYRLSSQAV